MKRLRSLFDKANGPLTTADTGRLAQKAAERYLRSHGYKILRRNISDKSGELDLIMRQSKAPKGKRAFDGVIVAEVRSFKARPNWTYSDALPDSKKQQVCESARRILPREKLWQAGDSLRFDAIIVEVNEKGEVLDVKHFPNDFAPDDRTRF